MCPRVAFLACVVGFLCLSLCEQAAAFLNPGPHGAVTAASSSSNIFAGDGKWLAKSPSRFPVRLYGTKDDGPKRKRRRKISKQPEQPGASSASASPQEDGSSSSSSSSSSSLISAGGSARPIEMVATADASMNAQVDARSLLQEGSKLSPIAGTPDYFKQKSEETNAVERFFEDLLAPTPVGEEPKAVKAAKAVTWFAVIVLVVIEIGVSIKTGGMPFDGDRQAGLPTPAAVQETAE